MMRLKYLPIKVFTILFAFSLTFSCTSKKNGDETTQVPVQVASSTAFEVTEDKSSLAKYYKLSHINEWYPERILPPSFDYTVDLTDKTIVELWLLRNEIFARNGYLFEDAVLRGHFNQFKWYQPIFDVPEFKVQLNKEEQTFIDKVLARENELLKHRYIKEGNYSMVNFAHVYNEMQFKSVSIDLKKVLAGKNFAIVPAQHEQFFHVYDRNHYEYIPNFITTDIYLQVLHKHFSSILRKIEEDKFIPLLTDLLKNSYQQAVQFEKEMHDEQFKKAAKWTTTYLAIAYALISDKPQPVADEMTSLYKNEMAKIMKMEGRGSDFLKTNRIVYSQFKPRGNYTETSALENYFRCVKWLNTAPIYCNDDERFLSAILIASFIKRSPELLESFQRFNQAIRFIVGEEDHLSIANLINCLSDDEANNPSLVNNPQKLNMLRKKVNALNVDKIRPQGGDDATREMLSESSILFTAGRYTFDAEILGRLIHVLSPEPKRPFPKGLDVFAAFGNKEAENILLNEYQEEKKWKAYPDTLKRLQSNFSGYRDWNNTIFTKTFEVIKSLDYEDPGYPRFMKTPSWQRKNLITSLAAWTELKHDMLLYAEQPFAAQAGEGGGPPPPLHLSYVEPNVKFWEKCLELLNLQQEVLGRMDLVNEDIIRINEDLKDMASMLLKISKKELSNEKITTDEFNYLSWLGGRIEYLTFRIFGSDHLPQKERLVAVTTDVYNYNGKFLEEAVGMVDEIYVIAEINGKPYLTKGAVFSYYEFNCDHPLSDEDWRTQVTTGREPERPIWVNDITVKTKSLESKPAYSF